MSLVLKIEPLVASPGTSKSRFGAIGHWETRRELRIKFDSEEGESRFRPMKCKR